MRRGRDSFERITERQVLERFIELASVDGPSGHESEVSAHLSGLLEQLGMEVTSDDAQTRLGGETGNLFAWWEGTDPGAEPVFLSCHMDTVLPTRDLRVVVADGWVRSDGRTILGADDRAALAAYLEGLRAIRESGARCGPVQLVLTVSEQPGLLGARELDYSLFRARRGYVYDSSGEVGQLIVRGPYSDRFRLAFRGRKAHLGLAVEEGVNAIAVAADAVAGCPLGRIDSETVASFGTVRGGELPSIVPDCVEVVGEVRSLTAEKVGEVVERVSRAASAAARRAGAEVEVVVEHKYDGWSVEPGSALARSAWRAAERIGASPYLAETLGGADTNVFNEHGLSCMTLGNGFQKIHSFEEHISVANLLAAARHVAALLEDLAGAA